MSVSMDMITSRSRDNNRLFLMAQEILDNGYDTYSYVASKIFDKDYDACQEHYEDGNRNPNGKMMRDIAKKICNNTESIDALEERYRIYYLGQLVIKAFPFTDPYDIEEETDPDFLTGEATTFIIALTGYVRFMRFMKKQSEIDNRYI